MRFLTRLLSASSLRSHCSGTYETKPKAIQKSIFVNATTLLKNSVCDRISNGDQSEQQTTMDINMNVNFQWYVLLTYML